MDFKRVPNTLATFLESLNANNYDCFVALWDLIPEVDALQLVSFIVNYDDNDE